MCIALSVRLEIKKFLDNVLAHMSYSLLVELVSKNSRDEFGKFIEVMEFKIDINSLWDEMTKNDRKLISLNSQNSKNKLALVELSSKNEKLEEEKEIFKLNLENFNSLSEQIKDDLVAPLIASVLDGKITGMEELNYKI
ncbi:MAG: hypothetical protein RsTaC01_0768 [Candidatus Paraimprobicoccus trichonymphae]|uniref:Uncharacterized protein n=1 Tax=Candidatus Paraimprobicoccus trichonymphae TaxID=3033793 RepID=A0AA48I010_9FIRM|nr:MAG: hypothetical protein RsTaC01_0768 [Candidatus Paraimprobicoccus trichonymphae]